MWPATGSPLPGKKSKLRTASYIAFMLPPGTPDACFGNQPSRGAPSGQSGARREWGMAIVRFVVRQSLQITEQSRECPKARDFDGLQSGHRAHIERVNASNEHKTDVEMKAIVRFLTGSRTINRRPQSF